MHLISAPALERWREAREAGARIAPMSECVGLVHVPAASAGATPFLQSLLDWTVLEHMLVGLAAAGVRSIVVLAEDRQDEIRALLVQRAARLAGVTLCDHTDRAGPAWPAELSAGTACLVATTPVPLVRPETWAKLADARHAALALLRDEHGGRLGARVPLDVLWPRALESGRLAQAWPERLERALVSAHVATQTLAGLEGLTLTTASAAALARAELRRRRNAQLLNAGVLIEDPESTWIGCDATLEPGATVRPFCLVEGRSHVAGAATIGPYVRLEHAVIEAAAIVLDHCVVRESVVGAGASVGPFAHLRPASHVGPAARVGNFVELKKTTLGPGSKAPHLSYLGDSTIGARVNVGAGTITCNYDGTHKHPTLLEDDAFIGSHTTLVAPVRVGQGAYVAAGSTITSDVPADALGVARSRQVVKDGWAAARRARQPRRS